MVKYATTDGDGRSAAGIDDAVRALHPMWKVNRLADHVHLGQTQFKAGMRATFSEEMFHGKTKAENRELQKIFSKDVKCRTSMVVSNLMTKYGKNVDRICEDLPSVLDATLRCYSGDCSLCSQHSMVCDGTDTSNWWLRSKYLASFNITVLQMNTKDMLLLQEILKMKLSEKAINSMKLYDTTNKNEAVHRSLSVNLPKNVNFARNMDARLSSGVHRNNNRPGTSATLKCQHLDVDLCEPSKRYLKKMDKDFEYQRKYEKRPEVKKRRLQISAEKLQEHKAYKELNKRQPEYKKDQLDPIPAMVFHQDYCKKKMPSDAP